ncbi:aminoglycoside phosphotransferase [Psychromonas ingrahamii 37]|uniref:Aminoglycoside phosphotransferase n=1 Tax=Psychromonas ingrahamii (strain DSM 17664 / CCUG 51855 / 37) TaxID=357804 RepID=A1SUR1_PSYIN|nr:phosphotransferase [Psychromonas ingrahamii]ABM03226.1 aminoglycoside phosphotransferase [Psychromonas ingrahamii 37]
MSLLTCRELIRTELTGNELTWITAQQSDRLVSIEPLVQALTNVVFLLTLANNKKIIFKRLNLSARDISDRKCEFKVDNLATLAGLTPKVIACCTRYKLQEYFVGKELSCFPVNKELINLLALQLKKIHQLPALHAQPQRLSLTLKQLKQRIKLDIDEAHFSVMLKRAIALDKGSARNVLCHGDLSLNNLLINDWQQVMILDWEYATLACPAYDLASCMCINRLDNLQQESLIAAYHHLHNADILISLSALRRECRLYFSVFSYLNALWEKCFLVNEISQAEDKTSGA